MSRRRTLIAINGRMGAGKSTVADLLLESLQNRGLSADLIQFRDLLEARAKGLLGEAVAALWGHATVDELATALAETHGPFRSRAAALDAADLAMRIADQTVGLPDPAVRTPDMRTLLQRLGSSWAQPGYWPSAMIAECLDRLDRVDAVVTTCRYPDEAQNIINNGGAVVRLDVSWATQRRRLARRDGFITDHETLNHPGEVALDHWEGFSQRFDTDKSSAVEIVDTILSGELLVA